MSAKGHAREPAPETRGRTIRWARWYDRFSWLISFGQASAIHRETVALAGVAPGESVLDVGCGTGTLAIMAKAKAGAGGEVHGVDAAPEMIEVAREKAAKRRVDVQFRVGLIEELPFPDDEFDIVLSTFMLHHLPDDLKRQGFAEIHRVLKPGGRFLAVDLGEHHHSLLGHVLSLLFRHEANTSSGEEMRAMLEEAEFAEVEPVSTRFRQHLVVRAKADKAGEGRA